MIIPNYISYCVKCGEYGHIGKSCKNIDENKMNIIVSNHQHAFMRTLYGTFPSLSNDINCDGEYQCKECNRVFRNINILFTTTCISVMYVTFQNWKRNNRQIP